MKQIKLIMAVLTVPLCLTACQGLEDLFMDEGRSAPAPMSVSEKISQDRLEDASIQQRQHYFAPRERTRGFFSWHRSAKPEMPQSEENLQQNRPSTKASRTEQAAEIPVEIIPVKKTKGPMVPTDAPSATGIPQ